MPIKIGTQNNPSAIYVGNTNISKVYVGNNLVWQHIYSIVDITYVSDINYLSATLASETFNTEVTIVEKGFVWDEDPNPTIDNNKVISGSGIGYFSEIVNFSRCGFTYYVRSYAIDNFDNVYYGEEITFDTLTPIFTHYNFTTRVYSLDCPEYDVTIISEQTCKDAADLDLFLNSSPCTKNSSGYNIRFEGDLAVGAVAYAPNYCGLLYTTNRNKWRLRKWLDDGIWRYFITYIDSDSILTIYYEYIPT